MKYFVRYKYTYYRSDLSWNSTESSYGEAEDSAILTTEKEFEDIYEVQEALRQLHSSSGRDFDVIALNKL